MKTLKVTATILVFIILVVASALLRVRRESSPATTSMANLESSGINAAFGHRQLVAIEERTEFQSLVADLHEGSDAGADCLKWLQRIAETRPALAINLALAWGGNSDERVHWVTELIRTWAARDAQAAWDWLGPQIPRMEPLGASNFFVGVVLNEMAAQAPQRVIDNVDTLLRRGAIEGVIPALVACQLGLNALLAQGNLDVAKAAVEAWIQNPGALATDASAFNVVAGAIAEHSWGDAAVWLETLPPSTARNSAFAVLASKWADRDPLAALDWAETLDPENGRIEAIGTVFSDWVERDESLAGDWLLSYIDRAKSESESDGLIGRIVTFSAGLQHDPQLAMKWVALIQDNSQRDIAKERVIIRWGRRELAAANQYVATAPELSASQRQNFKANLSAVAAEREPVIE